LEENMNFGLAKIGGTVCLNPFQCHSVELELSDLMLGILGRRRAQH
jgi:hypothetical protein